MAKKNIVRSLLLGAAVLTLGAQGALAANLGVDLNINLGGERQVAQPEPVYAPPPLPVPVMPADEDIQFVYPEQLGFYVAVGLPYDLFYLNNGYYLFRDGRWYRGADSRGPWFAQRFRELPPVLRRNRVERIRLYRDSEYARFVRDREHYHGRRLHPERGYWREPARVPRHEERREEREFRKDEKRREHEVRREEKELRKDERRELQEDRRERRGGRD